MPSENVRERKENSTFTLVLVPGDKSKQPRTFSVGKYKIAAIAGLVVVFFVSVIVGLLVFTPLGSILPIHHADLERQYAGKISDIQDQIQSVLSEVSVLKTYNNQLRKALGDRDVARDTTVKSQSDNLIAATSSDNRQSNESQTRQNQLSFPVLDDRTESLQSGNITGERERPVMFPLVTPALGYVTRGLEIEEGHLGIDIAGRIGTPVVASAEGNVIFADWSYDFGYMMIIAHSQGYTTVYKHNQSLLKPVGVTVRRGEVVAFIGNTGRTSSGPHLHFEVWKDGIALNPADYLLTTQ